jgi:hypothetical protein
MRNWIPNWSTLNTRQHLSLTVLNDPITYVLHMSKYTYIQHVHTCPHSQEKTTQKIHWMLIGRESFWSCSHISFFLTQGSEFDLILQTFNIYMRIEPQALDLLYFLKSNSMHFWVEFKLESEPTCTCICICIQYSF